MEECLPCGVYSTRNPGFPQTIFGVSERTEHRLDVGRPVSRAALLLCPSPGSPYMVEWSRVAGGAWPSRPV
ncbi:hypothetical protein NHX12_034169 [Muraenolepis orangiensis]|uniref:Uncharacterized protein n=1 Tax=Muraenolepis orangiensis TaxID=630683 RepID=A0A9Q0D797_9TELE|nr:hypothetical protein NHX12_034169 [Muraenolepis orangiensis]